jgi:hypothetical protein
MAAIRDPYTFTFTIEETEVLLQGLGKLPAEKSFNLLQRMAHEIAAENQARQAPPPAAEPRLPSPQFAAGAGGGITGSDMPTAGTPVASSVQ